MFTLAKDGMRPQLEGLWKEAFGDSDAMIKFFFDNKYDPNRCAVYTDKSGRVAAMLHTLPSMITEDNEIIGAQYIYAAATAKRYRGKGVMTALLKYASKLAQARGQVYSILVPANNELFDYYEKRGYKKCFGVRYVYMSRYELETLIKNTDTVAVQGKVYYNTLGTEHIANLRRDVLMEREGYVNWDADAVRYAYNYHSICGGSVLTATNGYEAGYAFYFNNGDEVYVSEFISHIDFAPKMVKALLDNCKGNKFKIRLPAFDGIFNKYGEIKDFGMISDTFGKNPINLLSLDGIHTPYIGLALD